MSEDKSNITNKKENLASAKFTGRMSKINFKDKIVDLLRVVRCII